MHGLDPATIQHLIAIADRATETVAFAFLDRAGCMIGGQQLSSVRADAIAVPLRDVVAQALTIGAYQVVMAHNHPSGNPEPSRADLAITRRMAGVFGALDIRLVDHIVLAPGAVVSFRARGLL